jgi:hypothetical protein
MHLRTVYKREYNIMPLPKYCFCAAEQPFADKDGFTPADCIKAEFALLLHVQREAVASKAY